MTKIKFDYDFENKKVKIINEVLTVGKVEDDKVLQFKKIEERGKNKIKNTKIHKN